MDEAVNHVVRVGELPQFALRQSPVEENHEAARISGRVAALTEVVRYVEDRLGAMPRYSDTRPYTDLLQHLADKIRASQA